MAGSVRIVMRSARRRAARAGLEPPPRPATPGPSPGVARALAEARDIRACDYRIPLARLRDEGSEGYREAGCGCQAVCLAGRSSKPDRLVGHECRGCPLAGDPVG